LKFNIFLFYHLWHLPCFITRQEDIKMNIPPPNFSSSNFEFSTNAKTATAGPLGTDPWVNAGLSELSPGLGAQQPQYDSATQTWIDQSKYYHMMYQQLLSRGNLDPKAREQVMTYDAQLTQWYQQVTGGGFGLDSSNWDPLATTNASSALDGQQYTYPVAYQDKDHLVSDEGPTSQLTIDQSDADRRRVDFFQMNNTLEIPSNSASVNLEAKPDDSVSGKTMVEATITYPDGTTRLVQYHNVERENFNLRIIAPDKTQVTLDTKLTSAFANKVTAHAFGEVDQTAEAPQGTPPDETDSDSRTWNKNDAVDYYVTKGTETDEIYADTVNITLPDRSEAAEVTKTAAHEYTVLIKDSDKNVIRTIHLHQVNGTGSINFNHLSTDNLQYKDLTGDSKAKFKSWDDMCDPQITVNGQAGGDKAKEAKAKAETEAKSATRLADQFEDLTKQINDAIRPDNVSKETKDKLTKLWFQLLGARGLVNTKTPDADNLAKAQKIFSEVKKQFDAMRKDLKADTQYPNWVDELSKYTGASGDSIISAIKSNYLTAPSDPKEFESWLKNNFPPMKDGNPVLDKNFSQFLRAVDPRLASGMENLKWKVIGDCKQEVSEIQNRVVQDLSKIFADKGITVSKGDLKTHVNGAFPVETISPTVIVNGKTYSCFSATENFLGCFSKDFGVDSLEFSEASSGDDAEKIVKNLESAFSE
jgi:hypothetical protein